MLEDIVEKASTNVVRVEVNIDGNWGTGTGLILDDEGTILTCEHVICPNGITPKAINIVRDREIPYAARLIGSDRNHDLAIIKCSSFSRSERIKNLDYDKIKIGQECFVLGYPIGLSHLTFAKSTISAKGFGLVNSFLFETIQIDARINKGNSGGPLFANDGSVIGIVTMKYVPFFHQISELISYVNSIPAISMNFKFPGSEFSLTEFIYTVNEGLRRLSNAIEIVQVGIGWVIPIHFASSIIQK